jgi:dATP pyrophosphohydrolase
MHNERALLVVPFFMPSTYKIPQSVLVVIYTPLLDVLLIRRADTGAEEFWQSVTGSKDRAEESFADTAVREVLEETGLHCTPGTSLGSGLQDWHIENVYAIYPRWLHRYSPGITHNIERVFGLCVPAGTPIVLNPREHTAYQWLPYRDAAELCFSGSNAAAVQRVPEFAKGSARMGAASL